MMSKTPSSTTYTDDELRSAIIEVQKAITKAPGAAGLRVSLASLYARLCRWEESLKSSIEAIRLDPETRILAEWYVGIDRPLEAIACYQAAIQLNPTSGGPRLELGNLYMQLGKCEDAVEQYEHAKKSEQDRAQACNNLALALAECERWDEAFHELNQLILQNPKYSLAHRNLAYLYSRCERWQSAIVCYKKAIDLNAEDAVAHFNLGIAYATVGREEEAQECYKMAISLDPHLLTDPS